MARMVKCIKLGREAEGLAAQLNAVAPLDPPPEPDDPVLVDEDTNCLANYAREALAGRANPPLLVAVTVLTSLNRSLLAEELRGEFRLLARTIAAPSRPLSAAAPRTTTTRWKAPCPPWVRTARSRPVTTRAPGSRRVTSTSRSRAKDRKSVV